MCNAFRKIPSWESKLSSQLHLAVDEKAFSKLFVKHKNFPRRIRKLLSSLYLLSRKSSFIESYTTPNGCIKWRDGSYKFPEKWYWKDGLITNDLDKDGYYPYFHFAVWKKNDWLNCETNRVENINTDVVYEFSSEGVKVVSSCE